MPDNKTLIDQTKKWLSSVIIEHNLCPFAKREYDNNRIHYVVINAADLQHQLEHIIMECIALDNDANRETSLLIFPVALSGFQEYLDLLAIATDLLRQQGYEGIYQFASFHPNYCFAGTRSDDPSNYTNRAPYPMIHILREANLEAALKNYPNPKNIPRALQLNVILNTHLLNQVELCL